EPGLAGRQVGRREQGPASHHGEQQRARGERAPDAPAVALRLDRPPTVRLPCRSLSHRPSVPGSAREAAEPEQPPHGRVLPRIFPTLDVSRVTGCDGAGRTTSPRASHARGRTLVTARVPP